MTEATPRPWEGCVNYLNFPSICAVGSDDIVAQFLNSPTRKKQALADRAFVLRAVNNYDEALALLREASNVLSMCGEVVPEPSLPLPVAIRIDAFLAKENSK